MAKCPEMPLPGATQDELELWAGKMVDLYPDCALRHNTLVDHING